MPIISNSVQNNERGSSSVTPRSRTYRSGGASVRLQEGQTLKGVVSDVHGNEITLSMEDGSSFTGKLPDANQYSIGQKAAFKITGLADNTIYLKAMTGAYLLDMDDTIEQALEEANLPKTERNVDVVRSLLQNQQSISRENILSSIQLCAQFPDSDVNAVITMQRLHLPLTKESIAQFEQYQNQNHQLLYKMDGLMDSVGQMMESIGSNVPRLAKEIGNRLLSMALEGNPSPEEISLAQEQAQKAGQAMTVYDGEGHVITGETLAKGLPAAAFDADGNPVPAETLEQLVKQAQSSEEDGDNPMPGQILEKETEAASGQDQAAANGPFSRMRQLLSNLTDGNSALKSAVARSGLADDFRTPFIHEQTGFLLPPAERESFSRFLSDYPLPESLKEGIADGTATAREFLTEIQKAFSEMTEEQAGKLLASKPFQALVKGQFLSNWTLTPEQLKEPGKLDEAYQNMAKQLETLAKLNEQTLGRDLFPQVSENAQDMRDNMDFMRMMNQTYQYIQLPLKLQNQNAHGDLYVMTRKESLKRNPKHLKALLHLDMDALGTLDIHITRENTAVSTHFYVAKKTTKDLLERNIELLARAIQEQGFAFTSELSMKEKEMDVVKDFIGVDAPVGDFKRYNFDLRA